jgi:DNA-binding CsgD family transcriptional regulator
MEELLVLMHVLSLCFGCSAAGALFLLYLRSRTTHHLSLLIMFVILAAHGIAGMLSVLHYSLPRIAPERNVSGAEPYLLMLRAGLLLYGFLLLLRGRIVFNLSRVKLMIIGLFSFLTPQAIYSTTLLRCTAASTVTPGWGSAPILVFGSVSGVIAVSGTLFFTTILGRSTRHLRATSHAPKCIDLLIRKGISAREREVIDLILEGYGNRRIADELYISQYTVKRHVYNIFKKLGLKSRMELVCMIGRYHALHDIQRGNP